MRYLVCLPAYNERENIAYMIEELRAHNHQDYIISDANSTDGSKEIAIENGAKVLQRSGHGKGFAVKDALLYAKNHHFQVLVLLDCDRTYPVSQIGELVAQIQEADMAIGCRNFKDISFLRRIANLIMTGFTNILFSSNVSDMATGMRALKVDKFVGKVDAKYFDIEPQMHAIALKEKMKIVEIPISYSQRTGESKINILDLFIILFRLFKERFR